MPGTFLGLSPESLCPRKTFSVGQTGAVGHPCSIPPCTRDFLKNSFIEIHTTYHKNLPILKGTTQRFSVRSPSGAITPPSHSRTFQHPKKKPQTHEQQLPFPTPTPRATTKLLYVSTDVTFLDILYHGARHSVWPLVTDFFHLTSYFQGSPCCSLGRHFPLFYHPIIFHFVARSLYLLAPQLMYTYVASTFWLLRVTRP